MTAEAAGLTPERLLGTWNRALGDRFPLRIELARQFLSLDVDADASAVEPEGIVVAKRSGDEGWVGALVVEPSAQRRGVGGRLLRHALESLRAAGARTVRIGGDRLHLLPGVPEPGPADFFRRRGVELHPEVVDLRQRLDGWSPPAGLPAVAPAGRWEPLLAFLHREFPGRWLWETEEARRRGADPGSYLLLREGGQVQGFARVHHARPGAPRSGVIPASVYWSPLLDARAGGLGPIGVAASMRGRGLGLGLLRAATAYLRARGVADMVIDWTRLVDFYALAGFGVWKRYHPATAGPGDGGP